MSYDKNWFLRTTTRTVNLCEYLTIALKDLDAAHSLNKYRFVNVLIHKAINSPSIVAAVKSKVDVHSRSSTSLYSSFKAGTNIYLQEDNSEAIDSIMDSCRRICRTRVVNALAVEAYNRHANEILSVLSVYTGGLLTGYYDRCQPDSIDTIRAIYSQRVYANSKKDAMERTIGRVGRRDIRSNELTVDDYRIATGYDFGGDNDLEY